MDSNKTNNTDNPIDSSTNYIEDDNLYTIEWTDIENIGSDYEDYLNEISLFFEEDGGYKEDVDIY